MMAHRPDEQRYAALSLSLRVCRTIAAGRPQSLYELAEATGYSARTIRRVLTTLQRAGIYLRRHRSEDELTVRYSLDRASWTGLLDLPD